MTSLNEELLDKLIGQETALREAIKEAKPKIQRVPAVLRIRKPKFSDLDLERFYEPRWMAVGPIHHGKPKYQLAEKYKLKLAAKFIRDGACKSWGDFYNRIGEGELKKILEECFDEEIISECERRGVDLCKLVVFDGCAILQFIHSREQDDGEFKKMKIKDEHIAFTQHDLLLLENQIPYRVLAQLIGSRSRVTLRNNLKRSIDRFIIMNIMAPKKYQEDLRDYKADPEPVHLLDLLLSILIRKKIAPITPNNFDKPENTPEGKHVSAGINQASYNFEETGNTESTRDVSDIENNSSQLKIFRAISLSHYPETRLEEEHGDNMRRRKPEDEQQQSFRSAMDLKSAGINFKPSNTSSPTDIHFSSLRFGGTLKLPPLLVDGSTASKFMNLTAYEMCPDNTGTKYEITTYLGLLDSLIDYPGDVKELRSAHILHNLLGCDDDVAQLFNRLSTDLVYTKFSENVEDKIERHCRNRWKTWMAQVYTDHFSSPWTVFAFIAAVFVIIMSAAQTWYAVFPR